MMLCIYPLVGYHREIHLLALEWMGPVEALTWQWGMEVTVMRVGLSVDLFLRIGCHIGW
jgi:hypothetical protein